VAGGGQPWDRDLFLETARARCSDEQYELIVKLLDQVLAAHGRVVWGQGSQPGFGAWYEVDGHNSGCGICARRARPSTRRGVSSSASPTLLRHEDSTAPTVQLLSSNRFLVHMTGSRHCARPA
jgi:hypothetical protein